MTFRKHCCKTVWEQIRSEARKNCRKDFNQLSLFIPVFWKDYRRQIHAFNQINDSNIQISPFQLDALTQISGIQGENTVVSAADRRVLFPPPAAINLANDPLFVFCHFPGFQKFPCLLFIVFYAKRDDPFHLSVFSVQLHCQATWTNQLLTGSWNKHGSGYG